MPNYFLAQNNSSGLTASEEPGALHHLLHSPPPAPGAPPPASRALVRLRLGFRYVNLKTQKIEKKKEQNVENTKQPTL